MAKVGVVMAVEEVKVEVVEVVKRVKVGAVEAMEEKFVILVEW